MSCILLIMVMSLLSMMTAVWFHIVIPRPIEVCVGRSCSIIQKTLNLLNMSEKSKKETVPINWQTIIKIIIAVLSAILGVIAESKIGITTALFNL